MSQEQTNDSIGLWNKPKWIKLHDKAKTLVNLAFYYAFDAAQPTTLAAVSHFPCNPNGFGIMTHWLYDDPKVLNEDFERIEAILITDYEGQIADLRAAEDAKMPF